MSEEWRPTAELGHLYEVSNLGRVRRLPGKDSLGRPVLARVLKPHSQGKYLSVHLYDSGVRAVWLVHRLVAVAFLPNYENRAEVNHLERGKLCSESSNLERATHTENVRYGWRTGQYKREACANRVCGTPLAGGPPIYFDTQCDAEEALSPTGRRTSMISNCLRGKAKSAFGYSWARA